MTHAATNIRFRPLLMLVIACGLLTTACTGNTANATGEPTASAEPTAVPAETAVAAETAAAPDPTEVPTTAPDPTAESSEPTVEPTDEQAQTAESTVDAEPTEAEPTGAPTLAPGDPGFGPFTQEERALVEAEVRAVHTRFMTELLNYDERTGQRGVNPELIEELTTGEQKQRLLDFNVERSQATDFYVVPGYETDIFRVDIDLAIGRALVFDCSVDQARLLDAQGNQLDPKPDPQTKLYQTALEFVSGAWRVTRFVINEDQRCTA